mmetsp:Transcript_76082/g.215143  ORF Transcript_76082/g.215143 Transcript_76082/m.215143 type:complete len:250 (-) Transcript_76082:77-826(-)
MPQPRSSRSRPPRAGLPGEPRRQPHPRPAARAEDTGAVHPVRGRRARTPAQRARGARARVGLPATQATALLPDIRRARRGGRLQRSPGQPRETLRPGGGADLRRAAGPGPLVRLLGDARLRDLLPQGVLRPRRHGCRPGPGARLPLVRPCGSTRGPGAGPVRVHEQVQRPASPDALDRVCLREDPAEAAGVHEAFGGVHRLRVAACRRRRGAQAVRPGRRAKVPHELMLRAAYMCSGGVVNASRRRGAA